MFPGCWPNNVQWSQIDFGKQILDKKTTKQWKRIGEKDSIVPAGAQLNLHHPVRSGVRAACKRQHHSVKFKWESFELLCRAAGTRQEAGAWWFSPALFKYSGVNLPKVFADSAQILGVGFLFGLFYLQYPAAICGFCIHAGILNVWQKYTSMLLANNVQWSQIDFGKHVLDKKTKKTMERNEGKEFYSSSWGPVEPTSSVCSSVRAACEQQHHSAKFKWESFELMLQGSRN